MYFFVAKNGDVAYSEVSGLSLSVGSIYTLTGVMDSDAKMTVTLTDSLGTQLAKLAPYNAKMNGEMADFVVRANPLVTPVSVPEPATATLSLLALAALAARRRRK